MKRVQNYLCVWLILVCVSACEEPEISSLSIKSSVESSDQSLAPGDTFELTVVAKDNDGIDFVKIESPMLGLDLLYENIGKKEWKLTKEVEIKPGTPAGEVEIMVTMKDDAGEENVTSSFLMVL
ncbi:MAG: hypothetical protein AAGD28_21505 [Bacteroidota bacterium]